MWRMIPLSPRTDAGAHDMAFMYTPEQHRRRANLIRLHAGEPGYPNKADAPMPPHQRFRLDNRNDSQDRWKPEIQLDKEPAIMVCEPDATMQTASQHV